MRQIEPFFREAGTGPGVVCLHSNASSSAQWRALMDVLAPRFHVLAPDSYGSGKDPEWPSDRVSFLRDEVTLELGPIDLTIQSEARKLCEAPALHTASTGGIVLAIGTLISAEYHFWPIPNDPLISLEMRGNFVQRIEELNG
jgi:hypothetical protein